MNSVRWCYSGRGLDQCVHKTLTRVAWMRCGVAVRPLHIPLDIVHWLFVISVFGDVVALAIFYRIRY